MNTSYNAMTVKEVLSEIAGKRILVPEFINNDVYWYELNEIESIFESILDGYPIGGFTFWNLEEPVPNIMFYEMTEHYTDYSWDRRKRFEMGFRPFRAVLDGRKRLNSLYIGLMGTYTRYTKPENEGEDEYPPRTLYLNLWRPETSESEPEQRGWFRFLTEKDYEKETQNGAVWVKAGRVLDEDVPSILGSVSVPPEGAKEAEEVLGRLADGICSRKIVCGCSVEGGPLDSVIGLLTRAGSNWRYEPAPELFYLLAANWDEARAEFERLKDFVKEDNFRFNTFSPFNKSENLKICLALIGDELLPSAERFAELIPKIRKEWRQIKSSARRTSSLFRNIWGGDFPSLSSNPALVIMYWFYKKGEAAWPKDSEDLVEKSETAVKKWMAFCDSLGFDWEKNSPVFKKIIDETENEVFPFAALRESIIDDYIRERIAEDDFEEILTSSWDLFGSRGAIEPKFLLPLLGSERAADELKKVKAVHLHPRSFFEDREKLKEVFKENPDDLLFAADPKNWDSVLNLSLMPVEKADMKEQMSLKEWAEKTGTPNSRLCVDDDVSLDIKDFRAFIENRRKRIKAILRDLIS